jgi:hypothetical protein
MKNLRINGTYFNRDRIVGGMHNLYDKFMHCLVKIGVAELCPNTAELYAKKMYTLEYSFKKFGFNGICDLQQGYLEELHQIKKYENRLSEEELEAYQAAYDTIHTFQINPDLYLKGTDQTDPSTKWDKWLSLFRPTKLKVALVATAGLVYSCNSFFTPSDAHIIARRDKGIERLETFEANAPAQILAEHTLAAITKEPLKFSPDKQIDLASGLQSTFNQSLPELAHAIETKQVYSRTNIELPIKGKKTTSPTMTATVIFTPPKHMTIAVVENGKPVTSNALDVEIAIESALKQRDAAAATRALTVGF